MSAPRPSLSVIMPVFNGAAHLRDSIESIIGQSYRDFEFIIIDDGSTDETHQIISDYSCRDARIRSARNAENIGLVRSLNIGLEMARADIIARMDADDISDPRRLELQAAFLAARPDHMFVSTSYRMIDECGRTLYVKVKPANDFALRWLLRASMCIEHPSTCFRARFPDGSPVRYDESLAVGEDYEFFTRLMAHGKGAILREVLFSYRRSAMSITSTRGPEVGLNYLRAALAFQRRELGYEPGSDIVSLLRCYLLREPASPAVVRPGVRALEKMLAGDVAKRPEAEEWLMRQAAGILAAALLRQGGGQSRPAVLMAFLWFARGHLWNLLLRYLEDRQLMPRRWESYPDPSDGWRLPAGGCNAGSD